MGRGQVVRHRFLVPTFAGSNPAAPATKSPDLPVWFFRARTQNPVLRMFYEVKLIRRARSQGTLAEARFEKVPRGVAERPSCRPSHSTSSWLAASKTVS